jgi:hypothetical protein
MSSEPVIAKPRRKLTFGAPAPDRSAGFPDQLSELPPPTPEPEPVTVVAPAAAPAADRPRRVPAAAPARRAAPRRARRAKTAADDGVGVYLADRLRQRLRTFHRDRQQAGEEALTYTDIVLDAIEANAERLGELLTDPQQPGPRRTGSLFVGRQPRRQRHDETHVQVTLRPSTEDLAVIEGLVEQHGAPSRSYLISRVLDAYLPRENT